MIDFFTTGYKVIAIAVVVFILYILWTLQGCKAYHFRWGKCSLRLNHLNEYHQDKDGRKWK